MAKIIIMIGLSLLMASCGVYKSSLSVHGVIPRKGYVFIKKIVNLKKCVKDKCTHGTLTSVGSGFIIKITHRGSFIATAAHVCSTDKKELLSIVSVIETLKVETLDGSWYDAKVLDYDRNLDACVIFARNLVNGVEEVPLSQNAPKEGDKVYNIASPYGIHYNNIVPIFEGRYFGETGLKAFYSFEAAPGSSGSMILNEDGELIGLLHSVYYKMQSVVVSARYENLIQFLQNVLIQHSTSHMKELEEYQKYNGIYRYPKL